jgi:hypothetical protein
VPAAPARHADGFTGDGYRDLATAAPYTPVAGKADAGAVVVTYGSSRPGEVPAEPVRPNPDDSRTPKGPAP